MNKAEREWNRQWGRLSRYNDEVAHGVVHTPEYDETMALEQKRYYEQWNTTHPDSTLVDPQGNVL